MRPRRRRRAQPDLIRQHWPIGSFEAIPVAKTDLPVVLRLEGDMRMWSRPYAAAASPMASSAIVAFGDPVGLVEERVVRLRDPAASSIVLFRAPSRRRP